MGAAPSSRPLASAQAKPPPVANGWRTKKQKASYASIPRALLELARVRRMSGVALRALLMAHAQWRGKPPILLPVVEISRALGIRRQTFSAALQKLVEAKLLVRTRPYVRPGEAGSQSTEAGRAAEWDLPHAAKGMPVALDPGDERLPGYWRIPSAKLAALVGVRRDADGKVRQVLSNNDLRVALVLLAGDRTKFGALFDTPSDPRRKWTAAEIAERLPGIDVRTAQRKLRRLVSENLAVRVVAPAGQRAAEFKAAGALADGLPWAR